MARATNFFLKKLCRKKERTFFFHSYLNKKPKGIVTMIKNKKSTINLYSTANLLCDEVSERIAAGQTTSQLEAKAQALLDNYGMDNCGTSAITVLSAYIDDYERMAMADEAAMEEVMATEAKECLCYM